MSIRTATTLFAASASLLYAGPTVTAETPASDEPWLTPTLNIRSRYEFADVDGSDVSHGLTFRERVGLQTKDWNGFSAFIEGEFTQAVVADYFGGSSLADPAVSGNSTIADPETDELNQLYLKYSGYDSTIAVGRQRIIYDNAAFIGNVGWRQNEQTFDSVTLTNTSLDDLTLKLAYISQVNRIFGSDAGGTLENQPGDIYLLNTSYSGFSGVTLGAYAYTMNFEDSAGLDNNTFGLSASGEAAGLDLYGELAWQDKAGGAATEEAWYGHVSAAKGFGSQTVTVGVEHLDAGFKTPLATVHAYNGFADAFIGGRLAGTHNGLTDLYVSHSMPVFWGMKWTNSLHAFGDNEISAVYGWEVDSVLAKKFSENLTGITKLAHFESEGEGYTGTTALPTTTRLSVELNYSF